MSKVASAIGTAAVVLLEALVPLALLAATVVLVWREPRLDFGNPDTVVYSVAADMWATGAVPYRDFIDHKPPGIYLFYRLCFLLGGHEPRAVWQGFTAITGLAAIALYVGFRLNRLVAAGTATAFAFCVFQWTDPLKFGYFAWNQTESLAATLGALAFSFLLVYRRSPRPVWALTAGAAFGAAVLSKQPAAFWALPLAIQLVAAHKVRPLKRAIVSALPGLLYFGIGAALPLGVCVLYFAYHRALFAFYDWAYLRNLRYAGIEQSGLATHYSILVKSIRWLSVRLRPPRAWPFAASLWLLPVSLVLRRSWLDLCAVVWVIVSLGAIATGVLRVDHYLVLLHVAFALTVGCAVSWLYGFVGDRAHSRLLDIVVPVVLCALVFRGELDSLQARLPAENVAAQQALEASPDYRLAEEIRAAAQPGERLFVFGQPLAVVFFTGMRPASKYIYWPADTLQPDPNELIEELETARPRLAYIGVTALRLLRDDQPGVNGMLARYLDDHYTLWLAESSGRVYVRRDAEGAAGSAPQRPAG